MNMQSLRTRANRRFAWAALALCLTACAHKGSVAARDTKAPTRSEFAQDLYARGMQMSHTGDHVRAEQYLQSALSLGYDREKTTRALISVCIEGSHLRAALGYAEPLLAANPEDVALRQVVALLFLAIDDYARARAELEMVVEAAPDFAVAHYHLAALIRDKFADEEQAVHHFSRYAELRPKGEHAREARAFVRDHQAKLEQGAAASASAATGEAS